MFLFVEKWVIFLFLYWVVILGFSFIVRGEYYRCGEGFFVFYVGVGLELNGMFGG